MALAIAGAIAVILPAATPVTAEAATSRAAASHCKAAAGVYRHAVERYLQLDLGVGHSSAECRAIRAFQRGYGIVPADGEATAITYEVLYWLWARLHTAALRRCPPRPGLVTCVDLDHQLLWVQRGGAIVYGPVPVRSGRAGNETPTGWFRVYERDRNHWSAPFGSPMPFSQFFNGGDAVHGVFGTIFEGPGSHGCVNLEYQDALRMWHLIGVGDWVDIRGIKPGT
jgi:hypothetical protein